MLADTLKAIAGKRLVDTDGETTVVELLPPATASQIRALEASLPGPVPDEIRAALEVTTGLANGPLESFSILDLEGFGLEEVFPRAYSIAHDGYGNYWVLDVLPGATDWGPVFFACHDPAVIAYQAPSIDAFLQDIVALPPDDPRSVVDRVHEHIVHDLWRGHGLVPARDVVASPDLTLRELAVSVDPNALIADLRSPRLGDGFAWGKFGARSVVTRHGAHRLWAITPPPAKPGLLARLFGR